MIVPATSVRVVGISIHVVANMKYVIDGYVSVHIPTGVSHAQHLTKPDPDGLGFTSSSAFSVPEYSWSLKYCVCANMGYKELNSN